MILIDEAEIVDLLETLQWSARAISAHMSTYAPMEVRACPWCLGVGGWGGDLAFDQLFPASMIGHKADCRLNAVLQQFKQIKGKV